MSTNPKEEPDQGQQDNGDNGMGQANLQAVLAHMITALQASTSAAPTGQGQNLGGMQAGSDGSSLAAPLIVLQAGSLPLHLQLAGQGVGANLAPYLLAAGLQGTGSLANSLQYALPLAQLQQSVTPELAQLLLSAAAGGVGMGDDDVDGDSSGQGQQDGDVGAMDGRGAGLGGGQGKRPGESSPSGSGPAMKSARFDDARHREVRWALGGTLDGSTCTIRPPMHAACACEALAITAVSAAVSASEVFAPSPLDAYSSSTQQHVRVTKHSPAACTSCMCS